MLHRSGFPKAAKGLRGVQPLRACHRDSRGRRFRSRSIGHRRSHCIAHALSLPHLDSPRQARSRRFLAETRPSEPQTCPENSRRRSEKAGIRPKISRSRSKKAEALASDPRCRSKWAEIRPFARQIPASKRRDRASNRLFSRSSSLLHRETSHYPNTRSEKPTSIRHAPALRLTIFHTVRRCL